MHFSDHHAAALSDILTWRRDVRYFKTDPIPADSLDRLKGAIDLAPSVGNARPWRIIRVVDAAMRDSVRDIFARSNAKAAKIYDEKSLDEYTRLKLAGLDHAPEHLAVFTETDPKEGRGLGRQTLPDTLVQSTAMAVHTLWLAARVENLGLGMVSILDGDQMKVLFNAPQSWRFTAYLCLGYPQHEDTVPLLHRKNWQENQKTVWEER